MTKPLYKYCEEWEIVDLEENPDKNVVNKVVSGGTPSTKNPEFWGGTILWLTPKEISSDASYRFKYNTERTITKEGLGNCGATIVPPDTVMLTKRAPLGKICINKEPMATNQGFLNFTCGNKLLPDFLYYWFKCNYPYLESVANGSTYLELYPNDLFEFEIGLPPIREQKAITDLLGAIDDKIELNNSINKTLEAIGKAIFKHWFIDFEFPNEDGKPYKSSGGEMFHSDELKKEIPIDWLVTNLDYFVRVVKGCSYKSENLRESKIGLVNLKCINRDGGFNSHGIKSYDGEYKKEQIISEGELVVAHTDLTQNADVLGRPAIIRDVNPYQELIASLDLCIVRPKENKLNIPFLYYLFQTDNFQNHAFSYSNGTTVLHLSKDSIPDYIFVLPEKKILDRFEEIIKIMINKFHNNEKESGLLALSREYLISKLVSGQIRLPAEVN
jgi:type I restriction enzyme, S subunit